MVTRHYRCTKCEREFETIQSIKDDFLKDCEVCSIPKIIGMNISTKPLPLHAHEIFYDPETGAIKDQPSARLIPGIANTLEIVYYPAVTLIKGEATTIGLECDRRNAAMGKFEYEDKAAAVKKEYADNIKKRRENMHLIEGESLPEETPKARPFWRKTDKVDLNLANMTKEKEQRYIMTGKK